MQEMATKATSIASHSFEAATTMHILNQIVEQYSTKWHYCFCGNFENPFHA